MLYSPYADNTPLRPTDPPQSILAAIQAELAPLLATGQAARLTINVSSGGHVRMEVARFRDVGKE